MSNRNWSGPYAFVVLFFVIVLLAGWITWDMSSGLTEQKLRQENSNQQHVQYAEDRIDQNCLELVGVALKECIHREIQSANDHNRATQDLRAQQSMALWAKIMSLVGILGTAVTTIGVYFVWKTLSETSRATNAALAAVAATEKIGFKQVRAYVTVSIDAVFDIEIGKTPQVRINIRNVGQTPALTLRSTTAIALVSAQYIDTESRIMENILSEHVGDSTSTVQQNAYIQVVKPMYAPIKNDDVDKVQSGETAIMIIGKVVYSDVFDQTHHTSYSFIFDIERYLRSGGAFPSSELDARTFFTTPNGNSLD